MRILIEGYDLGDQASLTKLSMANSTAIATAILFDARMVHYRRAGIGQYAINLLRAMRRLPEVGPSSVVSVLQMRGDAPIVNDPRFRRIEMWTPPHNRFEQAGLGVELLRLGLGLEATADTLPRFCAAALPADACSGQRSGPGFLEVPRYRPAHRGKQALLRAGPLGGAQRRSAHCSLTFCP